MAAYIALLVSACSLIVSFLSFYFTHFKLGTIVANIGLNAHLYHPRDRGSGLYLTVNLINDSNHRALFRKAYVEIIHPDGKRHYISWQRRSRIVEGGDYQDTSDAAPFFVDKQSIATDLFWFWWPDDEKAPLWFQAGTSQMTLYYWMNGEKAPRRSTTEKLELNEEVALELQRRYQERDPRTRIQPLNYSMHIGMHTTNDEPNWWRQLK